MRHLHEERLAGLALGDPDPLVLLDRAHLLVCRPCAGRLAHLRRIVATGRAGQPYPLREPSPATLAAIQAELGGELHPVPANVAHSDVTHADTTQEALDPEPVNLSARRLAEAGAAARGSRTADRRGLRPAPLLIAAAALVAVAVGGTVWYRTAADAAVVASATLTPLPDKSGKGRAELIRTAGTQVLSIDVTGADPASAFEELWLINTDGRRMISLGVIPPDGRGRYPVPGAGAALQGYTIVDISLEPYDGNVAHSHNSVLRGTLR